MKHNTDRQKRRDEFTKLAAECYKTLSRELVAGMKLSIVIRHPDKADSHFVMTNEDPRQLAEFMKQHAEKT